MAELSFVFLQLLSSEMCFQVCTIHQVNIAFKEFKTSRLKDNLLSG